MVFVQEEEYKNTALQGTGMSSEYKTRKPLEELQSFYSTGANEVTQKPC